MGVADTEMAVLLLCSSSNSAVGVLEDLSEAALQPPTTLLVPSATPCEAAY